MEELVAVSAADFDRISRAVRKSEERENARAWTDAPADAVAGHMIVIARLTGGAGEDGFYPATGVYRKYDGDGAGTWEDMGPFQVEPLNSSDVLDTSRRYVATISGFYNGLYRGVAVAAVAGGATECEMGQVTIGPYLTDVSIGTVTLTGTCNEITGEVTVSGTIALTKTFDDTTIQACELVVAGGVLVPPAEGGGEV